MGLELGWVIFCTADGKSLSCASIDLGMLSKKYAFQGMRTKSSTMKCGSSVGCSVELLNNDVARHRSFVGWEEKLFGAVTKRPNLLACVFTVTISV